jgi:hypothetical protein
MPNSGAKRLNTFVYSYDARHAVTQERCSIVAAETAVRRQVLVAPFNLLAPEFGI